VKVQRESCREMPLLGLSATLAFLLLAVAVNAADGGWVPGTSSWISVTDCVQVVRDDVPGTVRVDRVFDDSQGYRWDAPGARIRFRTDSAKVAVHLMYSARHIGPSRNSLGFYHINGVGYDAWTFTRPPGGALPGDAPLVLNLPVPVTEDAEFHDYELILPYGDSVELLGVTVAETARWETPAAPPEVRWVAFGDSVTHGFTSSAVVHSYPFLVGEAMGWQAINAGIGGRGALAEDGARLAGIDGDIYTVAIGVNNWQGGTELGMFRDNISGLLKGLLGGRPDARIYVITPLWVPPTWRPEKAKYPLEDYRRVIREVVADLAEERVVLIEGPSLIDHDTSLFDKVAVHPNDKGFAQIAERLVALFKKGNSVPHSSGGKTFSGQLQAGAYSRGSSQYHGELLKSLSVSSNSVARVVFAMLEGRNVVGLAKAHVKMAQNIEPAVEGRFHDRESGGFQEPDRAHQARPEKIGTRRAAHCGSHRATQVHRAAHCERIPTCLFPGHSYCALDERPDWTDLFGKPNLRNADSAAAWAHLTSLFI
jgi:lysophospholipase L1-like esterase